ncbi:MAG: phosphoribosylanthranilate isomerase [Syntrophales bacterium]
MTEIKICGITRREDALCAAESGADALGFIFHRPSSRYVTAERAREIIAELPRGIVTVGVFVNRPAEEVERIVATCGIDLIQLHGDESPDYCRGFAAERIIKAVSPRTAADLGRLADYEVRAFLADARDAGRYGGTGKRADWELAARIGKKHPLNLAGGLDAEAISAALAAVAPCAVDINSGCERSPGIKDHDLLRQIIRVTRDTDRRLSRTGGAPGPKPLFGKPASFGKEQ